jgi:hypothetical protein
MKKHVADVFDRTNIGISMTTIDRLKEEWTCFAQQVDINAPPASALAGFVGYSGDDIAKFLWMVRIGGGVYPHIKEPDYLVSAVLNVGALPNCRLFQPLFFH